jgi:hypothetical protein
MVTRMVEGVVIGESIREGTSMDGLNLVVHKFSRWRVPDLAEGQPEVWTIIEFESSADPDKLGRQFADVLDGPGWYVDFHTADTTYVVFPDKVMSYPRGDAEARTEVAAYARTVGVPDGQLDWRE